MDVSLVANLFNVNGIVAVVTGGGSGLGLYMTRALAVNGAKKLYILGRRKHVLDEAVRQIGTNNIYAIECDVTDQDALTAAVRCIEKDVGYIDLLVANSGISGPSGHVPAGASITEVQNVLSKVSMADFTNTFHVNCTALFYTVVAFLSLLDAGNKAPQAYLQGRSNVVVTSSIGSFNRRVTSGFAYSASKAAATIMVKCLATYLVPYHIRVNALCPGLFPTELTTDLMPGKNPTEIGAFPQDQIPAERAGKPEDIMGPLLYLASRAREYCNGSCVITDGGRLSVTPATY